MLARSEDEWDRILLQQCGIPKVTYAKEKTWAIAMEQAHSDVSAKLNDKQEKNLEIARRMFTIIEKEKALAEKESRATKTENGPQAVKALSQS